GNGNVSGIARCIGNASGDTSIAGRGDVRAANRRMRRAEEGGSEVGEPVWVGGGIVVDIGDDLPARGLYAGIPRAAKTTIVGGDHPVVILAEHRRRGIVRSIVAHGDFEVRVLEFPQAFEAVA